MENTDERSGVKCNPHPDAPHGFLRDASHNEGRYVCECEFWEPQEHTSDKEKLAQWMIQRGYATGHGDSVEALLHELEWQIREQAEKQEPVARVCYGNFTLTQTDVGIGERGMQAYEEAKKRGWVGISDE